MLITYEHVPGEGPTEEGRKCIQKAKKMPIVYDDDCPPLSEEAEEKLKAAVLQRNMSKKMMERI